MKRTGLAVAVLIAIVAMCGGVFAQRGPATRQIMLFDRSGKLMKTVGDPGPQGTMTISPDGKSVAAVRQGIIHVYDVATGAMTKVSSGPDNQPTWSADGARIAFQSNRDGGGIGLYITRADGRASEELQYLLGVVPTLTGWSADGRYLTYSAADPVSPGTGNDLWAVQIVGEKKALLLLRTAAGESGPRISPDGRFLTYRSDESGRSEFYIRPFDSANPTVLPSGPVVKISDGIATAGLRWRSDGREVYYISAAGAWMSVEISTTPSLKVGTPVTLFQLPAAYMSGQQTAGFSDVSGDGTIFALFVPATPALPR